MEKNNYFKLIDKSRKEFMALLAENGYKCNAAGREFMAERVNVNVERPLNISLNTIFDAEKLGGLEPGMFFMYPNAQGTISTARVCSLYNLPKDMVNPYLYCFGGIMTAPFYAMEILRFYAKQTGELLPFVSSGKEGNKGLFKKLFYRKQGFIIKTEYDAYYEIMARLADRQWVYANYEECNDDDSEGNLIEMYEFAKKRKLEEITLVICTGNPFYDKRLLAEWMWQLKAEKFADVRVNLVLAHCPLFLTFNRVSVPEARMTEIYLGYIAACIGPLAKDTITFDGKKNSEKVERYLMPGVKDADWEKFRDIIVDYSNMGWPNYQEILYCIPHEEAVANIILADLFAKNSYSPGDYDYGIEGHIYRYQAFLGGTFRPSRQSFLEYLNATTDKKFFEKEPVQRPYTD